MARTIDRYVIREVIPPWLIAFVVLTFTLELRPLTQVAEALLGRGAPWRDVVYLMALLPPQAVALTIPLSLLAGVLIAFVRMSADREYVAMQACGVSLFRLLRPVVALGALASALVAYATMWGAPAAAREFRERAFDVVVSTAAGEARPQVFIDAFPGRVIYMRDLREGRWIDVFIADSFAPARAAVYLARRGYLSVDRPSQRLSLVLEDGTQHVAQPGSLPKYEIAVFERSVVDFNWAAVFPPGMATNAIAELDTAGLRHLRSTLNGTARTVIDLEWHRRLSVPILTLFCGVLGAAFAASTVRRTRMASFALAAGVVLVHYVLLFGGRALAVRGDVPAVIAVWVPAAITMLVAVVACAMRGRGCEWTVDTAAPNRLHLTGVLRRVSRLVASQSRPARCVRILDWYVARLYAVVFLIVCCALTGVSYLLIVTDLAADALRTTDMARLLVWYCVLELPQVLYFVLPVSTLIAALVTVAVLTNNSEIVVMKACGISLYRVVAPLFVVAAVSSALLFGLQETWLPPSSRRAEQVRSQIRGRPERAFRQLNRSWVMGRTGAIVHYTSADLAAKRLAGLSVFEFFPGEWRLQRRVFAREAVEVAPAASAAARVWQLADGRVWDFSRAGRPTLNREFGQSTFPLEPIEYFRRDKPEAERMSYVALARYIDDLRASGTNVTPYLVMLRRKVSFPLITLIMVLIAVPFGVTTGREGAFYGIGVGVVLSFGYWTAVSVFGALGSSGSMNPGLAAWAPNLLFAAGAGYLVLTTRT